MNQSINLMDTGQGMATVDGHLFVLIHGLWGTASHMNIIEQTLVENLNKFDNIYYLKPKSFGYFKTYDGIKLNGDRVINEIFDELENLKLNEKVKINQISVIGYSLGGLIARYVIGELNEIGFFQSIEPFIFTTFATPHLGTKFFNSRNLLDRTLNFLGSNLIGQSGKDLFLNNSTILVDLADKELKYFKGLQKFKFKMLLANIRYDRTVSFSTSFITDYNPFEDWDSLDIKFLKDLPTVKLNDKSININVLDLQNTSRDPENSASKNETYYTLKRKNLILAIFAVLVPLLLPIVVVASVFGTVKSTIRKMFLPDFNILDNWNRLLNILKGDEKPYTFSEEGEDSLMSKDFFNPIARATQELVEESLNVQEYSDTSSPQPQPQLQPKSSPSPSSSSPNKSSRNSFTIKYDSKNALNIIPNLLETLRELSTPSLGEFSICNELDDLPYDPIRLKMCQDLNSLDWIKLPVFLKSLNAHESIVSRRGLNRTTAGLPVLYLWANIVNYQLIEDGSGLINTEE